MSAILASSKYLYTDTVPITALPYTLSFWYKDDGGRLDEQWWAIFVDASEYDYYEGYLVDNYEAIPSSSDTQRAYRANTTGAIASAGTYVGRTRNTWHHVAIEVASATSTALYFNGTSVATSAANVAWQANIDRFAIGRRHNLYASGYCSGKIAHVAIWDVALGSTAIANLASSANPLAVSASDLIAYWPLYNDEADDKGSNDLTNVGSLTYDTGDNPVVDDPPSTATILVPNPAGMSV